MKYSPLTADVEDNEKQEFTVYHCNVQGSGAATRIARLDLTASAANASGSVQTTLSKLPRPH